MTHQKKETNPTPHPTKSRVAEPASMVTIPQGGPDCKWLLRGHWFDAKVITDEFGLRSLLLDSQNGCPLIRVLHKGQAEELVGVAKLIADRLSGT